ncbi:esterase [Arthrobacter phage AbbyDaisy]|nr:esterase [Arthrobacter phage AbbyDaisy]
MGILDAPSIPKDKKGRRLDSFEIAPRVITAPGIAIASNTFGTGFDGVTKQSALQTGVTGSFRIPHVVASDAGDIRFVYTNWYTDRLATSAPQTAAATFADVDGPSTIQISALLETSGTGGAGWAVTFGGQSTVSIAPGGMVISDPVSVDVLKGATIYSVTRVISGNFYPTKRSIIAGGSGGFASGVDATLPWYTGQTHNTVADSTGEFYGPSAILGIPDSNARSFLIAGDSISNGFGDGLPSGQHDFTGYNSAQPWRNGGGYVARALHGLAGTVNIATSGEFARKFSGEQPNASVARRQSMARFCTDVYVWYGRNDVTEGKPLASIQGYVIAIWRRFARRGLTVHQATVTPKPTTTDSFMTEANQTPEATNDAVRVSFNDWLRDGAPLDGTTFAPQAVGATALRMGQAGHPLATVIDAADAAESARNSGKWKAPYLVINDAAMTSGSNTLTSASAAFTSARDLGTTVLIKGAGPTGTDLFTNISVVNSATSVTVINSAGTTVSGAQAGLGLMVIPTDRTHPTAGGAKRIAEGIAAKVASILA